MKRSDFSVKIRRNVNTKARILVCPECGGTFYPRGNWQYLDGDKLLCSWPCRASVLARRQARVR